MGAKKAKQKVKEELSVELVEEAVELPVEEEHMPTPKLYKCIAKEAGLYMCAECDKYIELEAEGEFYTLNKNLAKLYR